MTIQQNTAYILEHPGFRDAVERYHDGDCTGLIEILNNLQEDMYHKTLPWCIKTYRRFKWENAPVIEEAIRNVPPPENLCAALRIPESNCVVIKIPQSHSRIAGHTSEQEAG